MLTPSVQEPSPPHLPPTLPGLLEVAVARGGSAPFLGVRTSTTREASLTLSAFGDDARRTRDHLRPAAMIGAHPDQLENPLSVPP